MHVPSLRHAIDQLTFVLFGRDPSESEYEGDAPVRLMIISAQNIAHLRRQLAEAQREIADLRRGAVNTEDHW